MSGEPTEKIDPVEPPRLKCGKCGKDYPPWDLIAFGHPARQLCPGCWIRVVPKEVRDQAFKMLTHTELETYTYKVPKDGANEEERKKLEEIEREINKTINDLRKLDGDITVDDVDPSAPRFLEIISGYLFQLEALRQGQIKRQQEEIERLLQAQALEQFPRPPDHLTGGFTGALVPVEKQIYRGTSINLVTLRSTEKIQRRKIDFLLPYDGEAKIHNLLAWLETDTPAGEIKQKVQEIIKDLPPEKIQEAARKYQTQAIQKLGQLLSPRGLCLYRALQRELHLSHLSGKVHKIPGVGMMFFCDEDRILKVLYPRGKHRKTERVQEYEKLLYRMTSGQIMVDTLQVIPDGKNELEIKVSSPLFMRAADVEITKIPNGKRELAETQRGAWLQIPEGALRLFDYGKTSWHAWGDPAFLAMDIGVKKPYGRLAEDWIEEQLQVGWSSHQGKQAWSLNTILDDLGLRDQYLYPDGDRSKDPWPAWRRNAWIKKLLREVLWVFKNKQKRELWKTTLIRDPDAKNSHYSTIPNFLAWLNTPEGKRTLRKDLANNTGEVIQGALRFVLQVEIGPKHKLNQRHKITAEAREKRTAARRRKARAKETGND